VSSTEGTETAVLAMKKRAILTGFVVLICINLYLIYFPLYFFDCFLLLLGISYLSLPALIFIIHHIFSQNFFTKSLFFHSKENINVNICLSLSPNGSLAFIKD